MKTSKWSDVPINNKFKEIMVVKIGDKDRPAGPDDIEEYKKMFDTAMKENVSPIIITHHAVNFEVIKVPLTTDGKITIITNCDD